MVANTQEKQGLGSSDFPVGRSLEILEDDSSSTSEKKEALSSIGRKRDPNLKNILFKYSDNPNPEVALQAMRGLLVFRKDPVVLAYLESLRDHDNEMVRDVVMKELDDGKSVANQGAHTESPDFMKNVVVPRGRSGNSEARAGQLAAPDVYVAAILQCARLLNLQKLRRVPALPGAGVHASPPRYQRGAVLRAEHVACHHTQGRPQIRQQALSRPI